MARRREITARERRIAQQRRSQYLSSSLSADHVLEAVYCRWVPYDAASTSRGESRTYFRMLAAEVRRRMVRKLEEQVQ